MSSESKNEIYKLSGPIRVYRNPPRLYGNCSTLMLSAFIHGYQDDYETLDLFNQLISTPTYKNYSEKIQFSEKIFLWSQIESLKKRYNSSRGEIASHLYYDQNLRINTNKLIESQPKGSSVDSVVMVNNIVIPVYTENTVNTVVNTTPVISNVRKANKKKK